MLLHSPTHAPRPSIALISSMAVAHLITTSALAEQRVSKSELSSAQPTITLPEMGNTIELDRSLSREVSDTFVFGQDGHDRTISTQNGTAIAITEPNSANNGTVLHTESVLTGSPEPGIAVDRAAGTGKTIQNNMQALTERDTWKPVLDKKAAEIESIWQHIIEADRLPLTDHERVKFYMDQYRRDSLWISKTLYRGAPFLAHIVATLDQRFLPLELALLPAIESGFRPTAKSNNNATGLWQIVPITAEEIGVTQNDWFDGRSDVLISTTAAIDYLSYLNAEFDGDWELTLAAYNAGPGRIKAAIRKNMESGLPTDYWSLDLPGETLNYVPKLTALVRLIKMLNHGGLDLPDLVMEPAFESIDIGFRVSLDRAAEIAGIDLNLLRTLNAGLIHGVTAPQGPHYLLIPADSGDKFQQAFSSIDHKTAFTVPSTHNVASGDTISSIALTYGLTQNDLLTMNSLKDTKIRIGQKLAIIDKKALSKSVVKYVVSIGDTLSDIARKYSVNVKDITLSTGEALSDDIIRPGDTLNITVSLPTSG